MRLTVSEIAKLSGISVRTLHYYDEMGLLHPSMVSECGYRYYEDAQIERLQEILFYRELDFSLKEISNILSQPNYNKFEAFEKQKHLLTLKRDRLNKLIALLDDNLEGVKTMSIKEFDITEIEEAKVEYAEEVEERWGGTKAYSESSKKTAKYGNADWERIAKRSEEIFGGFAKLIGTDSKSENAQELVRQWQQHITDNFYECTKEILAGLGEMYITDNRFEKNIDKAGEGLAKFMSDAIKYYCTE